MNAKTLNDDLDLILKAVNWVELEPGSQAYRNTRHYINQMRLDLDKIEWQKLPRPLIALPLPLIGSNSPSWSEELLPPAFDPGSLDTRPNLTTAKSQE